MVKCRHEDFSLRANTNFSIPLFADQIATTEDGKKVILRDDGTWLYANSKDDNDKSEQDEYLKAETIFKETCKKDWPDDFSTRAFCESQQRDAVKKLKDGKPKDISDEEYSIIHSKCAKDWPNDFTTREFCEKQQFEAVRKLKTP
jgi:hypothetical protein